MREYGARNHISSFSDVCGLEDARFSRRQAFKLYATTSTYIITSSRHTRSGAQDRELEKTLCDNCVTLIPDSCETRSNQPPLLSTTCGTSSTYEKQGPAMPRCVPIKTIKTVNTSIEQTSSTEAILLQYQYTTAQQYSILLLYYYYSQSVDDYYCCCSTTLAPK